MYSPRPKESKYLSVLLPKGKQEIFIGAGLSNWLLDDLAKKQHSGFIIFCDTNFAKLYENSLIEIRNKLSPLEVIFVEPSEKSKSLEFLDSALRICLNAGLKRNGCILAIGGGIVGDIAGFFASVYMRGIKMIFVPTTLMAQGDTIINKVAISYKLLKNIIGNFDSPAITVCDTNFLQSLSKRELSLGLSEIIKHALISSKTFAVYLMNNLTSYESPDFSWEPVIYESLKIKARFVKKDPYDEKDIQKGLSYGHTFANALEGLSEFDFRHGEAVALGMRISGSISYRLGMLSEKDFKLQEKLLDLARLPSKFPGYIHPDEIITYLKKDKISTDGLVSLIILEKIGKHRVIKKVNEDLIMSVLNTFEP